MASFATLQGLHGSLLRSQFIGQDNYHLSLTHHHHHRQRKPTCRAEFNIVKMMGGRGLCNGEKGLEQELMKRQEVDNIDQPPPPEEAATVLLSSGKEQLQNYSDVAVSEDAFEKEMMGLTGGFPGGEKGLIKFIQDNPPTLITLSP